MKLRFFRRADNRPPMSKPMFDLDKANYARMATGVLQKLLASLTPRAKNPQTDWDKKQAAAHVKAIQDELRSRSVAP